MKRLALTSLLSLSACAGSVAGQVDGSDVSIRSGFLADATVGKSHRAVAVLSDIPDACATFSALLTRQHEARERFRADRGTTQASVDAALAEYAAELAAIDQELLPEEYRTVTVWILGSNPKEIQGEHRTGDGAGIQTCHQTKRTDYPAFFAGEDAAGIKCSGGDGAVRVDQYADGLMMAGRADVAVAGDPIGVSFAVGHCADFERAADL